MNSYTEVRCYANLFKSMQSREKIRIVSIMLCAAENGVLSLCEPSLAISRCAVFIFAHIDILRKVYCNTVKYPNSKESCRCATTKQSNVNCAVKDVTMALGRRVTL